MYVMESRSATAGRLSIVPDSAGVGESDAQNGSEI
jgi:hypothetical protein